MSEYYSVGKVTRLGKRADGEKWHYAYFNEDGSIDLLPGAELFAMRTVDEKQTQKVKLTGVRNEPFKSR